MGFQECSVIDALLIFPIAWKYETKNLIKKCIEILRPTELNENVCLTLNMASFCQCKKLIEVLLEFLDDKYYQYKLLDEEKYYLLLEPESVFEFLNNFYLDSYMLKNIFKWADNYLKTHQKSVDIKTFFAEYNIVDIISLESFETIGSIYDFNKSELGKGFFTPEECWAFVEENGYEAGKSAWFKIKAGETLIEKFKIRDVTLFENSITKISIRRNQIVLYDYDLSSKFLEITVSCYDYNFSIGRISQIFSENKESFRLFESLYDFLIKRKEKILSSRSITIEVKFTFHGDCRILKQSPNNYEPVDKNDEGLYFIKSVKFLQKTY